MADPVRLTPSHRFRSLLLFLAAAGAVTPGALHGARGASMDPAMRSALLVAGPVVAVLALIGWAGLRVRYLLDPGPRTLQQVWEFFGRVVVRGHLSERDELLLIGVEVRSGWSESRRWVDAQVVAADYMGRRFTLVDGFGRDLSEANKEGKRVADYLGLPFRHGERGRSLAPAVAKALKERRKREARER